MNKGELRRANHELDTIIFKRKEETGSLKDYFEPGFKIEFLIWKKLIKFVKYDERDIDYLERVAGLNVLSMAESNNELQIEKEFEKLNNKGIDIFFDETKTEKFFYEFERSTNIKTSIKFAVRESQIYEFIFSEGVNEGSELEAIEQGKQIVNREVNEIIRKYSMKLKYNV